MAKDTTFEFPPRGHVALLAYDSANDRWQAVYVDASGQLQVDVAAAADLNVYAHHYDGAAWRKSNLLWGYNLRWDEDMGGTASGTSYTKSSSAIPSGELWVLQAVSIRNTTRAPTQVRISVARASNADVFLEVETSPAQHIPVIVTGEFALAQGDVVNVVMTGTVAGDSIEGGLIGYKMDLAM